VLRQKIHGTLQIFLPVADGLSRKAVNQIKTDIAKAGPPGPVDNLLIFGNGMNPAEKAKASMMKRLYPDI